MNCHLLHLDVWHKDAIFVCALDNEESSHTISGPMEPQLSVWAVFSELIPASESFCASYVACPCPDSQPHHSTSSFQTIDLAHRVIYPHSRHPPHSRGKEVPPADLPPHIYSHRKLPELAHVQELSKFTSLLSVTHIFSALKDASISQKCFISVLSRTGTISKVPHILTCLKTTSLGFFFFFSKNISIFLCQERQKKNDNTPLHFQ